MESEINQTTYDINVYFVLPDKYEKEDECDDDMWDAYNKCPDWDIKPQWILESHCFEIKPDKKDVFVLEAFEGKAFEKLQQYKCVIVGPLCLLSCFMTGQPVPQAPTPVFNTAMRDCMVTASGFSAAVKGEIQKKVEYMGGIFTKQLRSSVTHLVTDIVMSAKYERAVELKINVVTVDWIKAVWDTNLKECIPATDSVFDKYKCPVFLNLVVTSTNLNKKQKDEIKRLINSNGGEFMGVLDGTKIKIVISVDSSSLSDKLKYAMQNNIPCLKYEWVYDSIKAGYSLPFENYLIRSTQACSTPEKNEGKEPLNFSTISMIPGDHTNLCVDETIALTNTMSSTALGSTLIENRSTMPKVTFSTIVDKLSVADAKKAGPFLDGCNIYLTGFSSIYRDKLNRILNVGSATRLDEISEALTHVIVGDSNKAAHDLRLIKSKGLYPYILKVEWLEECIKIKAPAPEDNFFFDKKDNAQLGASEPQSPLSKKNLQLLQRPKIPAVPLFDETANKEPEKDEHSEILQQYLQESKADVSEPNDSLREILQLPNNNTLLSNSKKNLSISERWNDVTKKSDVSANVNADLRDDSAIPVSQESLISQKILRGLVFIIVGFKEDEYSQVGAQIHSLGGKIVPKSYSGIPDYGVVPKCGAELKHTVGEVVTDLFIEDCIDNEKLVDVMYYHRPIIIPKNVKPLVNCVIGMSTYTGVERLYLSKLSETLGARYQDTFARKTNLEKNTYSSTHLICPKPQGEKYCAAVKWRLPAVTAEWLLQCAAEMKLVDETDYLVGETMAPDRSNSTAVSGEIGNSDTTLMKPPNGSASRLQNNEKVDGPGVKTPIINKRLTSLINSKTPQSPFHISTPETPYGQLFKENPSPSTRKAWVNYLDHFPDIPVEEPPSKRRKSTPFSEVKKHAWDFVTGRIKTDEQPNETVNSPEKHNCTNGASGKTGEIESNQMSTNRKLSFSEDSPCKTPKTPAISLQIAQLEEMLEKASNTPEARQSISTDHSNPYHLEPTVPIGRCIIKDSQPDSVGWEDPVKRIPPQRRSVINEEPVELENGSYVQEADESGKDAEVEQEAPKPKFMFSGIKDKAIAEQVIKELGGEVSTEPSFDLTATHLLCLKPSRNEKTLSSIAAGKWVLHYLYIEACKDEGKFVNEEEFEMGNPKSEGIIPSPNSENEKMIMKAAHRWRLKLLADPGGAFRNMVALLITPKEKKEQFERLIKAGGGIVVEAKPPYDSSPRGRKITHCFIQIKQVEQPIDWAMLASKGILCFPPQHLNDQLMEENELNLRDCVLPEFQKYLALLPK